MFNGKIRSEKKSMFHNIPNLLDGDLDNGELIRCLNICVSEGFRLSGGMRRKTVCKRRQGNTTQIRSIIFFKT